MRFPSTTEILKQHGFYSYLDAAGYANSEVGKNRGSAVDKAVTYLAMGELDVPWKNAHPELDCYIDAFSDFMIQHEWIHHSHQNEFVCQEERFVSHPDLLGVLDGRLTVLEVKTGAFPEFVRLQTAGQVMAEGNRARRRVCINLPGDGKYKLTPLNDPADFTEFTYLVRTWWILNKYGIAGRPE